MLFLILSEIFYDICISNGYSRPRCCRNSSAVEHFTRNEGVPGSNPGFGSKEPGRPNRSSWFFFTPKRDAEPGGFNCSTAERRGCLQTMPRRNAVTRLVYKPCKSRFRLKRTRTTQSVVLVLFYPAQKLPNKVFSALYSPSKYSFTTSKLLFFRLRKP